MGIFRLFEMAICRLLCASMVLVCCLSMASDDQVVLLQESADPVYPYDTWATEAARLDATMPQPPKEPTQSDPEAELRRWAQMTGLAQKVTAAKAEYAVHQQKVEVEQEEKRRQKEIKKIESQAMENAKQDAEDKRKGVVTPAAPVLNEQLSEEAKAEQTNRKAELLLEQQKEASAQQQKEATQQAEMVSAMSSQVKAAEDSRAAEAEAPSSELMLLELVEQPTEEAKIISQAKEGKQLKPTTVVCSMAKKGVDKICAKSGLKSEACAQANATYTSNCAKAKQQKADQEQQAAEEPKAVQEKEAKEKAAGEEVEKAAAALGKASNKAEKEAAEANLKKAQDAQVQAAKENQAAKDEAKAEKPAAAPASVADEARANLQKTADDAEKKKPETVQVQADSSLHKASKTSVHVKSGSSLHSASSSTTFAKKGSSLHVAGGKPSEDQQISGTPGVTRYYGKHDEILHRQDPLYNEHKVPEKTQKEASDTVHKIALATAEKTGKYGDENFQEYKQSVIAAAVEAASPKVAEIKHKANVKAMKEPRDVKARARATVEVSKKQEEKQEAATKAQADEAKAQQAVEDAKEKAADTQANGRDVSDEKEPK